MKRAIVLQIDDATSRKTEALRAFSLKATEEYNRLWAERDFCNTFMDFHRKTFSDSKKRTGFNVQVYACLERMVWKSKGTSRNGITMKFNVPRNCKTFTTKSFNFIEFGIYPRNRIAVPIARNRNFQRYSDLLKAGWTCKTYGLTSRLEIVAYLSKDDVELPHRKNILGIDFNAKRIAVSIVSDAGKVLYQTYFGLHIWMKRKRMMHRRSLMQSSFNFPALRKLRIRENNFVETNLGQMIKEITGLAIGYDADISIENLKRFKPKGRKFNKEVMRMPFLKFKEILSSRCFDKGITLNIIDSWHTSKFCSHCGAVARNGHDGSNYALFRCKECGVVVNSDRNASKNIAIKYLLERRDSLDRKPFQISNKEGLVNDLRKMSYETGLNQVVVQHSNHLDGKPTRFSGG